MSPRHTLNDPLVLGIVLAFAAVILVSWLLARTLPKAGTTTRAIAATVCVLIIALVAVSFGIARAYPGPAWKHDPGTVIHWLHLHALHLGSYLALLIPNCAAALVAALRPHGGKPTTLIGVALSTLLIIPSLIIGLGIACNHAGACL